MRVRSATDALTNPGPPVVQRIRVEVVSGQDRGLREELDVEPIRIGTHPSCEVALTDPAVSGLHLELQRDRHGVRISDMGSTNGTLLGDHRLQEVVVQHPVTLHIGQSDVQIVPLDHVEPVELATEMCFGDILGESAAMRAVFARVKHIVNSDATVLITGETGTGKGLMAVALRDLGPRRQRPFVVVDCGAIPEHLISNELFGHERGSYTGAETEQSGLFERADTGTLFFDEIGDLPLLLQPALLGVLDRKEIRRVGGNRNRPIDVRVIAATNRDLTREVERGAFRADLFYRLAQIQVRMPPLRERFGDLRPLIEHLLREHPGHRPGLAGELFERFHNHSWPGNVRELKHLVERFVLEPEGFEQPPVTTAGGSPVIVDVTRPFKQAKQELVDAFEQGYLVELMRVAQGNISKAARLARIDRMYLYKLLGRHNLA